VKSETVRWPRVTDPDPDPIFYNRSTPVPDTKSWPGAAGRAVHIAGHCRSRGEQSQYHEQSSWLHLVSAALRDVEVHWYTRCNSGYLQWCGDSVVQAARSRVTPLGLIFSRNAPPTAAYINSVRPLCVEARAFCHAQNALNAVKERRRKGRVWEERKLKTSLHQFLRTTLSQWLQIFADIYKL